MLGVNWVLTFCVYNKSMCASQPAAVALRSSWPHCIGPAAAAGQAGPFSAAAEYPEWPPFR